MSVNLSKNNEALVAAWNSVVDDKSPVNWAVFDYEGQTNNLKVVETGTGGLEQMIEELNSCHIMYAFCRVVDTKTSLPKCVLVNWQGELAPIVRKATCANHIRDIERLLKGAHIQINARSEEDVEVEMIMEKLARATGSAYKFQAPRSKDVGNTAPVGTAYKRVIPAQEINATERDEFWQKEELEEKARVEQERIRRDKERQRVELETRSREEKQSKMREQQTLQMAKPKLEIGSEQRVQELKNLRNQHIMNKNGSDSEEEPKSKSDELRRQRSNEAQQLIAQRTINARAVFEQNSAAGQMKGGFTGKIATNPKTVKPVDAKIEQKKPFTIHQMEKPENKEPIKIENTEICKKEPITKFQTHIPDQQIIIPDEVRNTPEQVPTIGDNIRQAYDQPKHEIQEMRQVPDQVRVMPDPVRHVPDQGRHVTDQVRNATEQVRHVPEQVRHVLEQVRHMPEQVRHVPEQVRHVPEQVRHMPDQVSGQMNQLIERKEEKTPEPDKKEPTEDINTVENELYSQLSGENYLYFDPNNEGMKARALYDYQAADDTEITFDPGDVITHIDAIDEGWWQGLAPDGTYGLFPANYVEVIEYAAT